MLNRTAINSNGYLLKSLKEHCGCLENLRLTFYILETVSFVKPVQKGDMVALPFLWPPLLQNTQGYGLSLVLISYPGKKTQNMYK